MKKNNKWLAVALGAAAVGVYRAVKGKGVFNKYRFAEQHEAVANYVQAHYPNAFYSNIEAVGDGWTCVVTDGNTKYLLYLTCSENGVFIFDETQI